MAKYQTVAGSQPLSVRGVTDDKPCDRCGKMVTRNNCRHRKDGLKLCRDCLSDKWFIEKAGKISA